jgi:hypothetical protein
VAHSDIKEANILIDREGDASITSDSGSLTLLINKSRSHLYKVGQTTPECCSPDFNGWQTASRFIEEDLAQIRTMMRKIESKYRKRELKMTPLTIRIMEIVNNLQFKTATEVYHKITTNKECCIEYFENLRVHNNCPN